MASKSTSTFRCTICETEIEVPLCCEDEMRIKEGELVCGLCGTEKTIPICCGRSMKTSSA